MISDTTSLDSVSCQVVEALNKVEGIIGGDGGKPGKTTACVAGGGLPATGLWLASRLRCRRRVRPGQVPEAVVEPRHYLDRRAHV